MANPTLIQSRNSWNVAARRSALWAAVLCLGGCVGGNSQSRDPVVVDYPIAYVKRPVPLNNQDEPRQLDARDALTFNEGGDLYIRDRAAPGAPERNVTFDITGGLGDVKDVEVSYDGNKLLFALRMPEIEGADEEDQPKWEIWEYDFATGEIDAVITSTITREAGHDIAPHYLPDGRIVFASTRQRQSVAILLDESKPQFAHLEEDRDEQALVLHVMNSDGSGIRQISFNQSHDLDPMVLRNGRVAYTRWDHAGSRNAMSLYTMNPDGTAMNVVYGAHSHETGTDDAVVQFVQPRELEDGRLLAILRPFTGTYSGGDLIEVDANNFVDVDMPTWSSRTSASGSGQSAATRNGVTTDGTISPGGRYRSFYPLADSTSRMLVSWSPCRVVIDERIRPCTADNLANPDAEEAAPLYGIYIYDRAQHTQLPVVPPQEEWEVSEAVVAQARTLPEVIYDQEAGVDLDSDFVDESVGVLHIRSVYDFDGSFDNLDTTAANITSVADMADPTKTLAAERPARFLRVEKAVSMPEDVPDTAFGRSSDQLMREIIGYSRIEPDGSVMMKVPANVALAISVLDQNGRRLGERHQNWIQVRPGETITCNGCHSHTDGGRHGHADADPAVNSGATTSGPFPNSEATLSAELGETMAQTRVRITCPSSYAAASCAMLSPSVDVEFVDDWTNAGVRAKDASFDYSYADLTTTTPATGACQTTWTAACRTVIHYPTHIHPLWSVDRAANTCTTCHNIVDGANAAQIPAAQLDLSDGVSDDEGDHLKSYRELLFGDNEQELAGAVLQDRLVPDVDEDGNPILVPVAANGPSMSTTGANASYFFDRFAAGGTHAGFLTDAELRLISEWLDIGAQYYNDPFAVP